MAATPTIVPPEPIALIYCFAAVAKTAMATLLIDSVDEPALMPTVQRYMAEALQEAKEHLFSLSVDQKVAVLEQLAKSLELEIDWTGDV